ncbi:hypothetical protein OS190_08490 [Sulfitobacter sp. F26204]|nr:hypothetical protein [Sulfitobacter sp. F26204]MCX7559608.1 hypothetical protein [Sulfitobacter sp. F26204]
MARRDTSDDKPPPQPAPAAPSAQAQGPEAAPKPVFTDYASL